MCIFLANCFALVHSYATGFHKSKAKKPHAILKILLKSCFLDCAKLFRMTYLTTNLNKFSFLITRSIAESSKYLTIIKFSSLQQ